MYKKLKTMDYLANSDGGINCYPNNKVYYLKQFVLNRSTNLFSVVFGEIYI